MLQSHEVELSITLISGCFFVTVPSSMGRSTARYEGCRYFFIFPQQQATTAVTKL